MVRIALTYAEAVEPPLSHVAVTDPKEAPVIAGAPTTKDDGRTPMILLKTLRPGTYQVEWHVPWVDTPL
jgi:methionine-rich copper-binding protein CopC